MKEVGYFGSETLHITKMISNMILSFKRTDGLTLCQKESCISLLITPSLQYNNNKFLNTIWMIRFSITKFKLFSEQESFR